MFNISVIVIFSDNIIILRFFLATFNTLRMHIGTFITVGLPEKNFEALSPFTFNSNGAKLRGSHVGSKVEALRMLQLAADKGLKPWVELLPMKEASKAVQGVREGKARYRYVLTQDLVAGEGNSVL